MISFDEDYQRERNESKRREKPRNALFGVGYGLKEFAEGIFKGVTGVVVRHVTFGTSYHRSDFLDWIRHNPLRELKRMEQRDSSREWARDSLASS
jgi:hypothetical protein